MIKANADFDNWRIPDLYDLTKAWIGQFNNRPSFNNVPILTYDDFPMYISGLSHNEAVARFSVRFTGYVKNNVNFIPFEVDAWVFPIPPYPEVEYPYFPVEKMPYHYL